MADRTTVILPIEKWHVKTDRGGIQQTRLFDWKTNDQFKFSSGAGTYTSSFQWNNRNKASHFFLDLGKVCFTSEVYLNGKFAGRRIFDLYILEITKFLRLGTNQIEVRIITSQLNKFIGLAKANDTRYSQYKDREDQVLSAGLIGPVYIRPGK